jgi:thiol-disulfide isomerase/thioredoxin
VKKSLTQKQNDSIRIQSIIKYTPDKLLRQVVLTEFFKQKIERSNSIIFEQFYDIAKNNIQEPFLWEPLLDLYNTNKKQNEIPKEYTTNLMMKSQNSSVKEVMDSIITTNQGKVIYLDCWATWCGPCKAEMSRSKQLLQNTNPDQVAFVFVCVDSDKKNWEKTLKELDIKGQHYFLTKEQSDEFRKVFNIRAVPYYCLFDKSGIIVDKGNHLRPDFIKEKLKSLL